MSSIRIGYRNTRPSKYWVLAERTICSNQTPCSVPTSASSSTQVTQQTVEKRGNFTVTASSSGRLRNGISCQCRPLVPQEKPRRRQRSGRRDRFFKRFSSERSRNSRQSYRSVGQYRPPNDYGHSRNDIEIL